MNPSDPILRFDELCAGYAMGDLTQDESRELAALCQQLGQGPDESLESLAACMEMSFQDSSSEVLPPSLAARLHRVADDLAGSSASTLVKPPVSAWRKILVSPVTGWAAAAAIAVIASFGVGKDRKESPAEAQTKLRSEAGDLLERGFTGVGEFKDVQGSVIWSDVLQRGYMTLSGIPANDPSKAQYQLWIVDPKRDEAPVDGGVFDISGNGRPSVVPITAKLALTNPQAFVITLEQPGGVVKSKQETVVALAKN